MPCFSAYSTALSRSRSSKLRVLPRRDDLQVRVERHVRQLEAHLVVALAGRAVADGIGAGLLRDFHLLGRDQRPGDATCRADNPARRSRAPAASGSNTSRRTPGAGPSRPLHPRRSCWALSSMPLSSIALPQLGRERDELHAGIALLEPGKDDGRIQPAGVGEDDFLRTALRHQSVPLENDDILRLGASRSARPSRCAHVDSAPVAIDRARALRGK